MRFTSPILKYLLYILDNWAYKKWNSNPLTKKPLADEKKYQELAKIASSIENPEVTKFENNSGFKIDSFWLNELALKTQIVIKKSELNYAHGKVLYSALRQYISNKTLSSKKISILETGTARGFSSLCMAKALYDSDKQGTILTLDVLPHKKEFYWNCITDHQQGKITREKLLEPWQDLVNEYIIFHQGYSRIELPKIGLQRINFAFLDGAHSYDDVFFEFNIIKKAQREGDIIIFDDYNHELFPGIVKAVDEICSQHAYNKKIISSFDKRNYVVAIKA
jgi:predicted O-methyltransferase YrrM